MKSKIIVCSPDCVNDIVEDIAREGYNLLGIEERDKYGYEYVVVYEGNYLEGWSELDDDDYVDEEDKEEIRNKFSKMTMDISLYNYLDDYNDYAIGGNVIDLFYSGKLIVNGEKEEEED